MWPEYIRNIVVKGCARIMLHKNFRLDSTWEIFRLSPLYWTQIVMVLLLCSHFGCFSRGTQIGDNHYGKMMTSWWSTHLKNISQIGSFPHIGMKIKHVWNHHLNEINKPQKNAVSSLFWHPTSPKCIGDNLMSFKGGEPRIVAKGGSSKSGLSKCN